MNMNLRYSYIAVILEIKMYQCTKTHEGGGDSRSLDS
jgi:hypothetical protein